MTVTCDVLGPVVIRIDDAAPPPELLWKKNVGLLLYLAFSARRSRTREQIIGMLWADRTDTAARQSAREAIRTLRRHLGADAIVTNGDIVELQGSYIRFDTDAFEKLAANGEWTMAVTLARGDFADGFAVPNCAEYETWLSAERSRWNRRLVDGLVSAGHTAFDTAALSPALDCAERALRLDAGAEDAVALAMRAEALIGRRAHALQRFGELTGYLQELGTTPSDRLSALADRIKRERIWRRTPAPTSDARTTRDLQLVGRDEALTTALAVWTTCRSTSRAGMLLLEADPGYGKTRLADELLQRARLDGATTVTLRCVPGDRDTEGSGVLALVRSTLVQAPGVASAPTDVLGALAAAAPEWGDAFPHVSPDSTLPLSRALQGAVEAAVDEQPLVLLLDDAQWLDESSLGTCTALLRTLVSRPLFVIITSAVAPGRETLDQLRSHLGREIAGTAVALTPLALDEVLTLVREQLADYPPEQQERIGRRLLADSGGIPLLAVELLRAVAAGMELAETRPDWPHVDRTLDETMPSALPPSVVGAIRLRFRAVSQAGQNVLRILAVGEDRLHIDRIHHASGLDRSALDEALDELEWERFLQCDQRGYAFVARIVRHVILEDMTTAGQRRRIRDSLEGDTIAPPP